MELILTPLDVEEGRLNPRKAGAPPAPGGFWISGYSGLAQIYDPAGRLVLSREIKGETLISPLGPGVYFVV
ncbi:MAG: T9SS type A sorting domain-containing protein, partial [Candidatus Hydrothermia bacterium]